MPKLAFFRASAGGWFDRLIARVTRSPYSHVELVFSDGISFSSMSADGGVRWKRIDFSELTREGTLKWDFLPIACSEHEERRLRAWCQDEVGKPYARFRSLGCSLLPSWPRRNTWFCSEICAHALQNIGYLPEENPAQMSPAALHHKLTKSAQPVLAR